MLGQPDARQLVEAVARFIETVAAPRLDGHAAFHARVAVNALHIVARELERGPAATEAERQRLVALIGRDADLETLRWALVDAIRAGRAGLETPGLCEHLTESAADRVRIEQPGYASLRLA